jgi:flagellar secretion chaperone FliS
MFGSPNRGANAYAKVGLETGVVASSPHKLIVMLFDGALVAARAGMAHMAAGETEKKGLSISKAINIIDNGLRASLDRKAGEVAQNLDSLYEYMSRRLIEANLKNDPAMLDEVIGLLADLKGAWDAIGENAVPAPVQAAPAPVPAAPQRMMAFDNLAPRRASLVSAG